MNQTAEGLVTSHSLMPPRSRRGKGFLAVCLSLLLPGLGHLVAGELRRGLLWFGIIICLSAVCLTALAVPVLVPTLLVLVPISVAAQIWMLVSAYLHGRRSARPMLANPVLRYMFGATAVVLALVVAPVAYIVAPYRACVAETFVIPTASMDPTLVAGDRFVCHKLNVQPARWDVVVFEPPRAPDGVRYVLRVAGLPGETLELRDGLVHVNGNAVSSPPSAAPYVDQTPWGIRFTNPGTRGRPITLGPDEYYLLGDNSSIAADSRTFSDSYDDREPGAVPRGRIMGRVSYIYWPPSRWRRLN